MKQRKMLTYYIYKSPQKISYFYTLYCAPYYSGDNIIKGGDYLRPTKVKGKSLKSLVKTRYEYLKKYEKDISVDAIYERVKGVVRK